MPLNLELKQYQAETFNPALARIIDLALESKLGLILCTNSVFDAADKIYRELRRQNLQAQFRLRPSPTNPDHELWLERKESAAKSEPTLQLEL